MLGHIFIDAENLDSTVGAHHCENLVLELKIPLVTILYNSS